MGNFRIRAATELALVIGLASGAATLVPARASAQYFGRNKVQYQTFNFRVMHTEHFDIMYYAAESLATLDAARMAERWYVRHHAFFNAEFKKRTIVFYADHPDYEQTNIVGGFIDQSTGGVTEGIWSRVTLPFDGIYADDDHVIGHELVHVFQYDIASATRGGLNSINNLPQWMIEGMAEYLSIGRDDPNTAMWLRDAALRNDLPTIKKLSTDPRYFPYRYGQALWAYIGGRWGDETINAIYRAALTEGMEGAIRRILGMSSDTLSAQWLASIRATYLPMMAGRQTPDQTGARLLPPMSHTFGDFDVAPSLSPDGRYVAFVTSRSLLSYDLYVADAETGKIVRKLTSPNADSHFDAIAYVTSSGGWSPDGRKFAFIVEANGNSTIQIFDVAAGHTGPLLKFKNVGAVNDVSWSPDGTRLVFSGLWGGLSDIYIYDLKTSQLQQVTHDKFADLQPTWSPDGHSIAWSTDRAGTNFDRLQYGPMQIAVMDLATDSIRILPLFPNAKEINPQYAPDGKSLYFVSDREGYDDIYRVDLTTGQIYQVTRTATGVSGVTALSPTLSVASQSGRLMFSLFERGGYTLHRLEAKDAQGVPITTAVASDTVALAGLIPPVNVPGGGEVTERIHDPLTGLLPPQVFATTTYHPSLQLAYLGSPGVGIGVATGPFGGAVAGGGVSAYFTDLLGNDVVGAAIAGGGDIRNFGGQAIYQDLAHRWNWGAGISHTPFITGGAFVFDTTIDAGGGQQVPAQVIEQEIQRTYIEQAMVETQYPFSMTKRVEFSGGFTHIGYGLELDRYYFDQFGNAFAYQQTSGPTPPGVNYGSVTAAYVVDYSYFGLTSPIAGGRYRLELTPTFGGLTMNNVLVDYRRYFYARPFTFAVRAIHIGRYGSGAEDPRLYPLYVGDPQLVRGYEPTSFNGNECVGGQPGTCPVFDRLIGSRAAVANAEFRIPIVGPEGFGIIHFNYLPIEIAPFFDAGVAWTAEQAPNVEFVENTARRVPVFSTGMTARINVLGYAVLEVYYAYPFQRPQKGGHFGFQLIPGW